jgi:hypothetical protein
MEFAATRAELTSVGERVKYIKISPLVGGLLFVENLVMWDDYLAA